MKKKALRKEFYMEIYKTRNRFLSLLVMVALGVAFFSGVRSSNPDMVLSADTFYDDTNLMDIRVLSTLGVTKEDAEAISQVEGVREVMPGYSMDMLGETGEKQLALQVQSLPEVMNQVRVREGRLPQGPGECLADTLLLDAGALKIGDTITLKADSDQETEEIVNETEFVVVGAGTSPLYLSLDRGTTTVGTGSLDGFLMIPEESFAMDYYTQICVTAEGAKELTSYSDTYDEYVDELVERIEEIADARCEIRYNEVQQEGQEKIAEAEADIADGEQKLADAKAELTDGKQKLADAEAELLDAQEELADGEAELLKKEQELADARAEIDDGWSELTKSKEEMSFGILEIEKGNAAYEENMAKLSELQRQKTQLEQLLGTQSLSDEQLGACGIPRLSAEEMQAYQQQLAELTAGAAQMEAELAEAKVQLTAAEEQMKYGTEEAAKAEQELQDAENEWADGYAKIQDAKEEIEEGKQKLAEAEAELADAKQELKDGEREYQEALAENEPKIADAKEKIADAKEELAELEYPEWYVLDRQYIQVYVEFGQDAERIGAIGDWFPAIFFLVAALVCLTTMTRMVEEQRTQIGTLKALGYSSLSIASKYIFYALLSSLLGSGLGIVVGQTVLPLIIINAYRILYANLPEVLTPLNVEYSVTASLIAVLCTTVASLAACYKELLSVPAALMRPQAPKAGKRVFLEYLPFLWHRLNFSHKATVRNLVRYKKRFYMTICGIGGCMALLLLGFGLWDSISCMGTVQYDEIRTYSGTFSVDEDAEAEEKEQLYEIISADERVETFLHVRESALDVEANGVIKSGYMMVPEEPKQLEQYIHLRERESKEKVEIQPEGVVITEKLAKLLDVQAGDSILLKEDETQQVETVVTGIAENYFMHYVFLSPEVYEALYEEAPRYNAVCANLISGEKDFEEQLRMEYLEYEAVTDVTFNSSMKEHIMDMLNSLNIIIWVLVVAAGLLAFVVLYNLNNINVSERRRELATLKVLGFYDGEVTGYVNRENVILTVLGAFAGVFLGILFHRFLIVTVEIDILMFGREIAPMSYVYSVLMTFLFSFIVNGVMHFKLKKIDMVESMKSVE